MGKGKRLAASAASAASATSATCAQEDTRARMIVGSCTHHECSVRAAVVAALASGGEVCGRSIEPAVVTTCTSKDCTAGGVMHAECYARLEQVLLRHMETTNKRTFENLKMADKIKCLWGLKYDMVRPFCRCACGQGYLRAEAIPNHAAVRRVGDNFSTSDAEERRAKLEVTLQAKAQQLADAKARDREEKAREREEGRQRNLQEKAWREQRRADRERELAERAAQQPPPLAPVTEDPFNWGMVTPQGDLGSQPERYVPLLEQANASDWASSYAEAMPPSLPPMLPPARPAASFDLGREVFPTLDGAHAPAPATAWLPAPAAGASSSAVGSAASLLRSSPTAAGASSGHTVSAACCAEQRAADCVPERARASRDLPHLPRGGGR